MTNLNWRLGHGIDPLREWARRDLPGPNEGLVLTDIDLAVRRYGPRFNLDAEGDLMLVEMKERDIAATSGERHIFNWIDKAITTSVYRQRYRGSHLMKVAYDLSMIPACPTCGARDMTADQAYRAGLYAQVYWQDRPIDHDELKRILLGIR